MSFRCENCNEAQESRAKPKVKVTKTREKIYKSKNGETIGWGNEIVTEMKLCDPCDELPVEELQGNNAASGATSGTFSNKIRITKG